MRVRGFFFGSQGVPRVYWFGRIENYRVMLMEGLGYVVQEPSSQRVCSTRSFSRASIVSTQRIAAGPIQSRQQAGANQRRNALQEHFVVSWRNLRLFVCLFVNRIW